MSFEFLPDQQLYADRDHCLREFKAPPPAPGKLIFHTLLTGELTPHHCISLGSLHLAVSQPAEIWLWMTDGDLERNRGRVPPYVRPRVFTPEMVVDGAPLQRRLDLFDQRRPVQASDWARWAVLNRWGGFGFDLDMLFLRDPRPLANLDFCYQWSDRAWGNAAFIHIRRGEEIAEELQLRALIRGTVHPRRVLDFDWPTERRLLVLPSPLFDPLWVERDRQRPDAFTEFFEPGPAVSLATWFPGAFAYHWHGQWGRPLTPSSAAGQLAAEVAARLGISAAAPGGRTISQ